VKIRLVSAGRDKGPTAELAQEYAERIRRFAELEILELRAAGISETILEAMLRSGQPANR